MQNWCANSCSGGDVESLLGDNAARRQMNGDACTGTQSADHADAAAMRLRQAFDDREPQSGALGIAHEIVPALAEALENVGLIFFCNTGPFIHHTEIQTVHSGGMHKNADLLSGRSELRRVQ